MSQEQFEQKEKPPFLYHGSTQRDIEIFEPRISEGTGTEFGPLVYATPDISIASIFLSEVKKDWSAGRFGDIPYVLITLPREKFIEKDRGGAIYVLPSESFSSDEKRGLGTAEWFSQGNIKPVQKLEYNSALEAMIENGVQVYFVDEKTYQKIKDSKDHGFSILNDLESENKRIGVNYRKFKK